MQQERNMMGLKLEEKKKEEERKLIGTNFTLSGNMCRLLHFRLIRLCENVIDFLSYY